jgi:hypothetical protein
MTMKFKSSTKQLTMIALTTVALTASSPSWSATVSFVSANPISNPDSIIDFTSLPDTNVSGSPKNFGGLTIEQVQGDPGNSIYTTIPAFPATTQASVFFGNVDRKIWYPAGGDLGYTKITLTHGDEFGDMGLFVSSGGAYPYLAYQLLNDGFSVGSGVLSGHVGRFHWLSILGGGFDTLYLKDGLNNTISFTASHLNALALDTILVDQPTAVPVPGAVWLMGSGLLGLLRLKRRPFKG